MAAEPNPQPNPPPIISMPPEPSGVHVVSARGSDSQGYVILTLTTETGPFAVRFPIERAEQVIKALELSARQARTGLIISNGHVPF
jgi:hypothetical protein